MGRFILATCDVDPDRPQFGGRDNSSPALSWRGLEVGVRRFVDSVERESAARVHLTWFIRADEQIERIHGDAGWCFKRFEPLWRRLQSAGHEIGWHFHLWRWTGSDWRHEEQDHDWIGSAARRSFEAIPDWALPGGRQGSIPLRMGIDHQSNFTFDLAEDLGVRFDCSATPGLADAHRDWLGTPTFPYRPSRDDYRVPASLPSSCRTVVEIPNSTYRLPLPLYLMKRLRGRHGRIAEVYLTKHPILLRSAFSRLQEASPHFTVTCHADEFLPDRGAFSLSNAIRNIRFLDSSQIPFATVSEFGGRLVG